MDAVEAVNGVAALAGNALITGGAIVVEVGATGALQEGAADGSHVADLRGSPGKNGTGEDGVLRANRGVLGDGGVAGSGTDAEAACGDRFDGVREGSDINKGGGSLGGITHQVNEVGGATEILGAIDTA